MSDISQRLARLERGILAAVKEVTQNIPYELQIYTEDYLNPNESGQKTAKSGRRYYPNNNTSGKLRTLYGNIARSLEPGGKGNFNKVEFRNGKFEVEYGYDPETQVISNGKTISLKYALYNELGAKDRNAKKGFRARARPFLKPGFAAYMRDANGYKALIKELETTIVDEFMQEFG
jgi:hypothetical protein